MVDRAEVGVIVPLKEEFRQFCAVFKELTTNWNGEKDSVTGEHYYRFEKHGLKCVVTFCGAMGEGRASRVTERLIAKYAPDTIIVLGIAAGIDSDLQLGDVVIATVVESYIENSKAVADGEDEARFVFKLSGEPYRTNHSFAKDIDHLEFNHQDVFEDWKATCSSKMREAIDDCNLSPGIIRDAPEVHSGHVACGPTVGASTAFVGFLKNHDRKFLALEMESGGVLASIDELPNTINSLVIRGISDFGDERKKQLDDTAKGVFRRLAIFNATSLLLKLLDVGVAGPGKTIAGFSPPGLLATSPLRGCSLTTHTIKLDTLQDTFNSLKENFGFVWETFSFRECPPVVYWPVRLRTPTPIHAVQTFAAAAIIMVGGEVVLCLDDLGKQDHKPDSFFSTIRRWCKRVGVEDRFEERRFSEMIEGSSSDAWEHVQKWLGLSEQKMVEVLRIAKILRPGEHDDISIGNLRERRPRRLLTPAMVWSCLAQVEKQFPDRAIITLGGIDERPLWKAWRDWIVEGERQVGHLYIPSLGEAPLHMSFTDLGWECQEDVTSFLRADVLENPDTSGWQDKSRVVPWLINGCVALPDFVESKTTLLKRFEMESDVDPAKLIVDLAREVDDRLFRHI